METQIKINASEFRKAMAEAKRLSKSSVNKDIPISVQPERIEMQFIGLTKFLAAETTNLCDVVVPFLILESLAKTVSSKELVLQISDGLLICGNAKIQNKKIQVQSLFFNPETDLPLNVGPLDLLSMRHKYSIVYLDEKGFTLEIEKAEEELETNLRAAEKILKIYGISYATLEALVSENIKNKGK